MYDAIIIGAGVIGCAIARELSKYQGRFLVLEKQSDVCEGTSKANSGIIHAGYDAIPGSLKAKLNVLGNEKMTQIAKDLNIPFVRNGSIVVCYQEEEKEKLQELYDQGIQNGVKKLELLSKEELQRFEPNLSDEVVAGLVAKTAGTICPFTLTIALAENAASNGVEFAFNSEVRKIESQREGETGYIVTTDKMEYVTKTVINAAGVYADVIHNMICEQKMTIHPRKGEYCLFDKELEHTISHTIFQLPSKLGKGILVTKTVHGNLLIGPTAMDTEDKEQTNTSSEGLNEVMKKAQRSVNGLDMRKIITSFAGLRAHESSGDFIIEEAKEAKGFFDVAGIASPGLSASCAIGDMVSEMVRDYLCLDINQAFEPKRSPIIHIADLPYEEREALVAAKPQYGNIICRCEMVSEGEIRDAITRTLGATTLDGIKRRTRAMMGRCQAGFCTNKCIQILSEELHKSKEDITKHGEGSPFLLSDRRNL